MTKLFQCCRLSVRFRRNSLPYHLLLFMIVIAVVVLWKLLDFIILDEPSWSICVADATKATSGLNSCLPLKWSVSPGVYENSRVSGKIMEPLKDARPLATFLVEPKVNDTKAKAEECPTNGKVRWTLVNFVKSSVSNHERRQVIRSTWGAVRVIHGLQIRNVFIVGRTQNPDHASALKKEVDLYQDILQVDLQDSATTVPEKVLAGMQWSSSNLQPHTIYSSMDDDIVIHVPNLSKYLQHKFLHLPSCNRETIHPSMRPCYEHLPILCVYAYKNKDLPERNWFSKWYTPFSEYSGTTWPTYCRGGMYVLPVKMVKEMFEVSRFVRRLLMDDVWITGFMRRKLGKGDLNIVPAPHSVRYDLQFRGKEDNFDDILVQHLWGDMGDGDDIPTQMSEVWRRWINNFVYQDACVTT